MQTKFNPRVLDRIKYERGFRLEGQLAEHLGIDRSTLIRWRRGDAQPNFAAIAKMNLRDGIALADMTNAPEQAAA